MINVLKTLVTMKEDLDVKIKKYGMQSKNAKPYVDERYVIENKLQIPLTVIYEKLHKIAQYFDLNSTGELLEMNLKELLLKKRYNNAKSEANLNNDTKVFEHGDHVLITYNNISATGFHIKKFDSYVSPDTLLMSDGSMYNKSQCFIYGTTINSIIECYKTNYSDMSLNDRVAKLEAEGVVFKNKDLIQQHSNLKIWSLYANTFGAVNSYLVTLEEALNMIIPTVDEDKFEIDELCIAADTSRLLVLLSDKK